MAQVLCPVVVGRDVELVTLRAAAASALRGSGELVFLSGEAGVGKSRLVREVMADTRARGAPVIMGRAVPTGVSTPYRPLAEALLQALRDRDVPDDADLAPWLPALGAILPTLSREGEGRIDDSPAIRGEAVLRLLRALARPTGLVVVLEDLHWSDPDTLAVVEYLGDNLATAAVLCLATTRSEPRSGALDLVSRLHARRGRAGLGTVQRAVV